MNENFAALIRHLDTNNITYDLISEDQLQFRISLDNVYTTCRLRANDRACTISACSGIKVREDKLPAMAEFVVRANLRNLIGRWDLDWDLGHLTFEASAASMEALTDDQFPPIIAATLGSMDRYYPAIMRILWADSAPAAAVAEAELAALQSSAATVLEGIGDEEDLSEFAKMMENLTRDELPEVPPKPKRKPRKRKKATPPDPQE